MTARQFKHTREKVLGLTQEGLAAKLGVRSGTVGRYDRGTLVISQPVAMAMELLVVKHKKSRKVRR